MLKLVIAALAFLSVTSFASPIEASDISALPFISDVKITVAQPPFAAVEPRILVEFVHTSCARFEFDATIAHKANGIVSLKISRSSAFDCMALGRPKEYTIDITDLIQRDENGTFNEVVILNPIEKQFKVTQ